MLQKIIKSLAYSIVLLLPLYLVRFSIFGIPTNLIEILIGVTFCLWLFQIKKTSRIFDIPKIYWLSFLLIFMGVTISAFLDPDWMREAGIIKGWFMAPFLFFLIIVDQFEAVEKINKIIKLLFVSSATVGLVSLFYLLDNNLTFDGRLQAFYLSPNHLAMFLTPGIIIGFFSIAKIISLNKARDISFYFPLLGSIIMLIALYCTFSYGAWIALFSSLLISLFSGSLVTRSQKIKAFLLTMGLLVALFSFQLQHKKLNDILKLDERSSFASRVMIWKSAWKIGQDNLVWGIGPGNFQAKYLEYQPYFPPYLEWAVPQPHNLYLAFWLQSGMLGLSGFLLLATLWARQIIQTLRNKKDGFQEAALLAIILGTLIHGLIDTPYWKNDLSILFWTVIALGINFILAKQDTRPIR